MEFELLNAELQKIGHSSNRFSDYYTQSRRSAETQEDRRRAVLRDLRLQKRDALLVSRYKNIFADVISDNEGAADHRDYATKTEEETNEIQAEHGQSSSAGHEAEDYSPNKCPKRRTEDKAPRLMLSEWLIEVPADFEDSWLMTICPEGKRCAVVANKGRTVIYSRPGKFLMDGTSDLPGGSPRNPNKQCYSVLDCILNSKDGQLYVLDVLFWNGSSLVDQSAEFRLFWLKSRLGELDHTTLISENEELPFSCLEYVPCDKTNMEAHLQRSPSSFTVDGMMFCHKDGCYFPGTTPLVCWLKPFMIPEILGIPVPDVMMQGMPEGYRNLSEHLLALNEKNIRAKDIQRSKRRSSKPGKR
ncbi:snurportin-1-like [Paramacrobiotus metropolitanus]|uniref:snurportin-1-like n=1 Tax=Paramacrobiotus metropolitanus TaxID=2943436 RepID=UPI00244658F4|nr:snurportin-1-like [Paramacrobiotus metropolitanus]